MTLSTLDTRAALVVLDVQKSGLSATVAPIPMAQVVRRSSVLAKAFRAAGLPVVLVNVDAGAPGRTEHVRPDVARPHDWTELAPELDPQPQDHLITKQSWGAFRTTDLEAYLRGKGITQIVLTGYATSISVESTARYAYESGFNVAIVIDAITDVDEASHVNSVTRIFPRLGETALTAEVLDRLKAAR
jgi:nicotinamidase-related amidase